MAEVVDLKAAAAISEINPRAVAGGNKPPLVDFYREQNEQLPEYLAEQSPEIIKRFEDLRGAFERSPKTVEDKETNEKFTDFIKKKIASCKSALKGLHSAHKEPFLTGGKIVDNFYLRRIDEMERWAKELAERQTEYNVKIEAAERRKREEAERVARAAAAEAERIAAEERRKAAEIAAEQERQAQAERRRREAEEAEARRQAAEAEAKIRNEQDLVKAVEMEAAEKVRQAARAEQARLEEVAAAARRAEAEAAAKTAAEEAARRQAMADEATKAAEAKSVELTRTRGTQGGVSSLRTEWKIEVADLEVLDLNLLKPYASVEDINTWLKGWLKPRAPKQGGIPPELPGARIYERKWTA